MKRWILLAALAALVAAAPARALQSPFSEPERSAGAVCRGLNAMYAQMLGGAASEPIARKPVFDGANGFDLCGPNGEAALRARFSLLRVHGDMNEDGSVRQLTFLLTPSPAFSEDYVRESRSLLRICALSAFPAVSEGNRHQLMRALALEILPCRYRSGDEGVADRQREISLLMDGEVVRVDSAASGEDDSLQMRLTFWSEPDAARIEAAREDGWRVARLSQALTELDMVALCAETFGVCEDSDAHEDEALMSLMAESLDAYAQLRLSEYPRYEAFAREANALCERMRAALDDFLAARAGGVPGEEAACRASVAALAPRFREMFASLGE